jgi:hypothetical protein
MTAKAVWSRRFPLLSGLSICFFSLFFSLACDSAQDSPQTQADGDLDAEAGDVDLEVEQAEADLKDVDVETLETDFVSEEELTRPFVVVQPDILAFGCVPIGSSSTRSFEVINDSDTNTNLLIYGLKLPVVDVDEFQFYGLDILGPNGGMFVEPILLHRGESASFSIRYSTWYSDCVRHKESEIQIFTNSPFHDGGRIALPLIVGCKCAVNAVVEEPETGILDFGAVPVGEMAMRVVKVSNSSGSELCFILGPSEITGSQSFEFSKEFDGNSVFNVYPCPMGDSSPDCLVEIPVQLAPMSVGSFRGRLVIFHNATGADFGIGSTILIELTGVGVTPDKPDGDSEVDSDLDGEYPEESDQDRESEWELDVDESP